MKATVLAAALIAALAAFDTAVAADLVVPSHRIPRSSVSRTIVHRFRPHVVVRSRVVWRKSIGMPCLLPPDVIVRRRWNGPQCRWVDNIIVPWDARIARVVY
jgi:hypothetical protein